jgi:ATP-binding cassette subfamily B protein
MEKTKKPKYNMWQNTAYMIKTAWATHKPVIILVVGLAVTGAGKTIAELLIAPSILAKIELSVPLNELIMSILLFTGILLLLSALYAYIDENKQFGRIDTRKTLIRRIASKIAGTSFPNILDTSFIAAQKQSQESSCNNSCASEAIWKTWTDILTNVLGFAVYLMLLSGLNIWLIALVITTTAISYFSGKRINEWEYRHREEKAEFVDKLSYIYDVATKREYAKDIRMFGLKAWFEELYDATMRLYQAFAAKRESVYIWTNIIDLVLTVLRNGVAYAYLIWLTIENGLPVSKFLLYFTAMSGFTQWVSGILNSFSQLHKQSLELSTLREFLEWPEPFKFNEGKPLKKALDKPYEIRLENVSYRYPEAKENTLSHVELTVKAGEKLAIVGLNGAGKTTLVKLICGFLDPTEGRVLLNGEDIRQYNRKDYYALFSAVFQDFSVLEVSVKENVAQRVDDIDIERVWRCLDEAGLTETVKALPKGIDTPIGRLVYEDGVELSGGQTQRLMLARALYKNGPILTLDEPTAALDPIAENDIYQKYSQMTNGRTSIFISHRLASTRFCDRILFIKGGNIAEEGSHEQLLKLGGEYARLFEVQSKYYQEGGNEHGKHE